MRSLRSQILDDLGIVAWRLRVAASEVAEPPPVDVRNPATVARASAPGAASSAPVASAASAAAPATAPSSGESPAGRRAPTSRGAVDASAAWSALSLSVGDVLVLVDGGASRRDLRLARDILAAAAGDWRTRPVSRRFDWPPPGAAARRAAIAEGDGAPQAFAAFVDKDLTDAGATLLICTETVAGRIPAGWSPGGARLVSIPTLERLGNDDAAKRAVWQRVRGEGR